MTSDALDELGEFLKARRAALSPRTVGLPDSGAPRRVAGLRREEVAQLAAVSTDYYTRLEQGRIQPSASVLTTLARVLHLGDDQRDHLFFLAGTGAGRPRRRIVQKVRPQLRRLLDELTMTPAMVLGRSLDVLAWNPLAAALFTDFARLPDKKRNFVQILFSDPAMRSLYADWQAVARACVAQLRMRAVKHPDDPRLAFVVGELSVRDTQFRQWWGAPHAASHTVGSNRFNHPVAGALALDRDALSCGTDSDQDLVVWTAEQGTPSYDGLRILASWKATQDAWHRDQIARSTQ